MKLPTPKFDDGDTVFWATTISDKKVLSCPDCADTKKWRAISPSGIECECACPRCTGSYWNRRDDLTIHSFAPEVQSFVVGAVRIDTAGIYDDAVTYMANSSGSGTVYGEGRCFTTYDDAMVCSQALAAERTATTPHCKASADHAREFATYTFTNAWIKEEQSARRAQSVRISMLMDDFRDAVECAADLRELKDDITGAMKRWEDAK